MTRDLTFSVGFFENSTKNWLLRDEDLSVMYKKFQEKSQKEICLWCDGVNEGEDLLINDDSAKRKKKETSSRREQQEMNVDDNFRQLKDIHGNQYQIPQLRLWARVIANGHHDSLDEPPDLPQFKLKSKKSPSLDQSKKADNMSPSKVVDTRGKYINQLQQVKTLFEEGILTEKEYEEQKEIMLNTLRKLK